MNETSGDASGVHRSTRPTLSAVPGAVWVVIGLVIVLLMGLIISGGLSKTEKAPPSMSIGSKTLLSQYSVTVLDAELTDAIEDQYLEAEAGETLIVLTMALENTSDLPIGLGTNADRVSSGLINARDSLLSLSAIEPAGSTAAWREDGSSGPVILQPGVPTEVRIAWPVSKDALRSATASSDTVQLDVYDARVTTGQILLASDQIIWRRGELAARINLDVGEDS